MIAALSIPGTHDVDAEDRAAVALRRAYPGAPPACRSGEIGSGPSSGGAALSGSLAASGASSAIGRAARRARLMTTPLSVRHAETSMLHRCAAARTSTSRAAAPAMRRRSVERRGRHRGASLSAPAPPAGSAIL